MKTKATIILIFLFITLGGFAQDPMAEKIKTDLEKLKIEFDSKFLDYNSKLADLTDPKNIINPAFDHNKIKGDVIKLKNDLTDICDKRGIYITTFEKIIKDNKIGDVFKEELCLKFKTKTEEFNEGILPKELTYLNAYNFDFNNTNNSGYLGHLSAFFPFTGNNKWYINAGLLKANYTSLSSMQNSHDQVDNILIHPLDKLEIGDEYLKEYNTYKNSVKISSYSAYAQLMYRILPKVKNLFVHAHIEFLVYDTEFTTEIVNVQRETLIATEEDLDNIYLNKIEEKITDSNTFYSLYTGVGVTGDFKIHEGDEFKLNFFCQTTMGYSNILPGDGMSIVGNINVDDSRRNLMGNLSGDNHGFYYVNAFFSNNFDGLNLIIGSQIRGTYVNPALYVFYVGVNTNLRSISKLFK